MDRNKIAKIAIPALLIYLISLSCNHEKPVENSLDMLTISDSTLSFTARAGSLPEHPQRTISVTVNQERPITSFQVTNQSDWLKLGPLGTDTIFVTIRSESLAAGQYNDTITITSSLGANTPLYLPVELTITNWFQASHDSLQFYAQINGNNPPSQFFQISDFTNTNTGYQINSSDNWINVSQGSGSVPDTVTVEVDALSLSQGSYRGFVNISSDIEASSDIKILITVEVDSWFHYPIPPSMYPVNFEGISFIDKRLGMVSGWYKDDVGVPYGVIYRTEDSGKTWYKKADMQWLFFGGITASDPENWWVAASKNSLIHSSNHGESWVVDSILRVGSRLNKVFFISVDSGWTIGQNGIIGRTTDGGTSWQEQPQFTNTNLRGIDMYNNYVGWICGDRGIIMQTIDGGVTWTHRISNSTSNLLAIDFVDRNNGWAVSDDGNLLMTNSGGALWTEVLTNAPRALYDISFANTQLGWICGENGVILRTNNGGGSWQTLVSRNSNNLNAIVAYDENRVWVTGFGGTILQTVSGGK